MGVNSILITILRKYIIYILNIFPISGDITRQGYQKRRARIIEAYHKALSEKQRGEVQYWGSGVVGYPPWQYWGTRCKSSGISLLAYSMVVYCTIMYTVYTLYTLYTVYMLRMLHS